MSHHHLAHFSLLSTYCLLQKAQVKLESQTFPHLQLDDIKEIMDYELKSSGWASHQEKHSGFISCTRRKYQETSIMTNTN